jgi:hypothetical protein
MPEIWIALTGFIILFLFWRQLHGFKRNHKINYAPLSLIVGLISSISLFVFSSVEGDLKQDIQYALMPLLISLIFYMVMYLMHQVKINDSKLQEQENERQLKVFISYIQEYFTILDDKLSSIIDTDKRTYEAVQLTLKNEFSVFKQLSSKQEVIVQKIEEMYAQEEKSLLEIHKFLEQDMLDLDKVVHRHIDILRIAEQDHFNKLQANLEGLKEQVDAESTHAALEKVALRVEEGEAKLHASLTTLAENFGNALKSQLGSMAQELNHAKQLSEALRLSTQEYEVKLQELHKQATLLLQKSDTIHESMEDTFTQSQKVRPIYNSLNELVSRLMDIYGEYKQAKKELTGLTHELGKAEQQHFEVMDEKIDALGKEIHAKIEASLIELKEHYHIADNEISNTVKTLAAKAQMQKSYPQE